MSDQGSENIARQSFLTHLFCARVLNQVVFIPWNFHLRWFRALRFFAEMYLSEGLFLMQERQTREGLFCLWAKEAHCLASFDTAAGTYNKRLRVHSETLTNAYGDPLVTFSWYMRNGVWNQHRILFHLFLWLDKLELFFQHRRKGLTITSLVRLGFCRKQPGQFRSKCSCFQFFSLLATALKDHEEDDDHDKSFPSRKLRTDVYSLRPVPAGAHCFSANALHGVSPSVAPSPHSLGTLWRHGVGIPSRSRPHLSTWWEAGTTEHQPTSAWQVIQQPCRWSTSALRSTSWSGVPVHKRRSDADGWARPQVNIGTENTCWCKARLSQNFPTNSLPFSFYTSRWSLYTSRVSIRVLGQLSTLCRMGRSSPWPCPSDWHYGGSTAEASSWRGAQVVTCLMGPTLRRPSVGPRASRSTAPSPPPLRILRPSFTKPLQPKAWRWQSFSSLQATHCTWFSDVVASGGTLRAISFSEFGSSPAPVVIGLMLRLSCDHRYFFGWWRRKF